MPNCFQLSRKSNPEDGPVSLNVIDEELCEFLGATPHDRFYCCEWFDWIGFQIAMGGTYATIREKMADWGRDSEEDVKILEWFETHFVSDSWVEIGKGK